MLYLFDLDNTLISSYMDNPTRDYHLWAPLPRRREVLAALRAQGHLIGVVTNQAGVAFGFITVDDFVRKWGRVLLALDLPGTTPLSVCFMHEKATVPGFRGTEEAMSYDPGRVHYPEIARRKPAPTMILEMLAAHPEAAVGGVLFVGDSPDDETAADLADVPYCDAATFFLISPGGIQDAQNLAADR